MPGRHDIVVTLWFLLLWLGGVLSLEDLVRDAHLEDGVGTLKDVLGGAQQSRKGSGAEVEVDASLC
jgi:hypothetical protein